MPDTAIQTVALVDGGAATTGRPVQPWAMDGDAPAGAITWHNGGSGSYTAYLGFDLEHHKAVVVLSDVAKSVDTIGHRLLVQPSHIVR
jgi:hypothetical protein